MSQEAAKKAAGEKAAELIENGMVVGLGTGSTAFFFIEALIRRCKQGLKIQAIASSNRSQAQAKKGGIPILNIDDLSSIDTYVDGADEIDPQKQMIKGGGGALLREKIVAHMSKEMIVVIDETKLSPKLGKQKLPVEILPFGHKSTIHKLENLGYHGALRTQKESFYLTENGNLLFDIQLDPKRTDPPADHQRIINIPGVIDTGFFLELAGRVVIGFLDGQIVIQ